MRIHPLHIRLLSIATFILVLVVYSRPAWAAVEMISPTVTGNVELTGSGFDFGAGTIPLVIQQDLDPNLPMQIDQRAFMEFPLALEGGGTVLAASLDFANNQANGAVFFADGYVGNGTAEVVDAMSTSNRLGVSEPLGQLGVSFPIDLAYIQGLIDSSATHLGVALFGSADGLEVTFGDIFTDPAVLNLTIADPGDFNLDGSVDGLDFLQWQLGQSPTPFSNSDLQDWENGYGNTLTTGAISAVPEPGALGIAVCLVIGALVRRPPGDATHRGY